MKRRGLLAPLVLGPLWPAALLAAEPTLPPVSRSITEPSYEVLLPDPDPPPTPGRPQKSAADDSDLDLASRVLSAAKQVTTVQEAPSIITVVTSEDLRSRGYRDLGQALSTIPGWMDVQGAGNLLTLPLVRGTVQAALLLRDGVSFFDPVLNAGQFSRALPLETVKRLEVVTGPGGVLWGANSFLGIINVISKDAEDIDGVEGALGYGDGPGSAQSFRAWVLFGKAFTLPRGPRDWKLKVVQHLSYETFLPPRYSVPLTLSRSPAPLPPGPTIYGPITEGLPDRNQILNIDGRLSYGPLSLSYAYPIGVLNSTVSFGNALAAPPVNPMTLGLTGQSIRNGITVLDRYLTLQYRDRFLNDRLGLDAKVYGIEFYRDIQAVSISPSILAPNGLSFSASVRSYRIGGTVDGDVTLPRNRLLFGGEAFYEWVPEATVSFPTTEPARLPLGCPLAPGSTYSMLSYVPGCPLTFVNGTNRAVVAAYVSDQFRPLQRLVLDGGVRVQAGLGDRPYQGINGSPVVVLGSAAVVWNFFQDMHLKANYATGFRPPVFNNTDSNGAAVQFSGKRDLTPERSQAFQGEWNARLLRGRGALRELQLRADYSYTQLDSLIIISGGSYSNVGADGKTTRRGIHSVEAQSRLYLRDHQFTIGYTFAHITTTDRGLLRSIPQQWASVGGVFSLWPRHLELNGTLNVIAGYDDPNRFRSTSLAGVQGITPTVAQYSDLAFDRLPPQAVLHLGLRARMFEDRLWSSLQFYNVFDQRAAYPDVFYDLTPTLETSPTPTPGWSFFLQIGGKPW